MRRVRRAGWIGWFGDGYATGMPETVFHIEEPLDENGDPDTNWDTRPNSETQSQGAGVLAVNEWTHTDGNGSYSGNLAYYKASHRPYSTMLAEDSPPFLWSDDFGFQHQWYNTVNDPQSYEGGHFHLKRLIHIDPATVMVCIQNPNDGHTHAKNEYYDLHIRMWLVGAGQLTSGNIGTLTDSWTDSTQTQNTTIQFTLTHAVTDLDGTWHYTGNIGTAGQTWLQDRADNGDKIGVYMWEWDY